MGKQRKGLSRRDFLIQGSASLGAIATAPAWALRCVRQQESHPHYRLLPHRRRLAMAVARRLGYRAHHLSQCAESHQRDAWILLQPLVVGPLPLGRTRRPRDAERNQTANSRGALGGGRRLAGRARLQYSCDRELCPPRTLRQSLLPVRSGNGSQNRLQSGFLRPRRRPAYHPETCGIRLLRLHAPPGARNGSASSVLVGGR